MTATRRRGGRGRRQRIALLAFLLVVAVVVVVLLRAGAVKAPQIAVTRNVAAVLRVPGPAPRLAWPASGEAAELVEGLGGMGVHGAGAPVPIASVAKVMTAYLTLRAHPLAAGQDGFTLRLTKADVADERDRLAHGESVVGVRAGERLTEREALEALLLPSANNVAALLARHSPGGMDAFLRQMNETALKLGMRSTTYTDPSGFTATTVSTAADQVRLGVAAMRIPAFAQIVALPSAEIPVVGTVLNFNGLVGHAGYVGIKTGSDSAAGGCLLFAKRVVVGGRHLLVVGAVLGQRDGELIPAALASAQRLGDSVAASIHTATLIPAGRTVLRATRSDGLATPIVTTRAIRTIGWGGLRVPLTLTRTPVGRELAARSTVATLRAGGGSSVAVARDGLGKPSFGWRLRHLL